MKTVAHAGLVRVLILTLLACSTDAPTRNAPPSHAPSSTLPEGRWGGLDVVERGQGEHVVVLLHGYGAPGHDLVSLGDQLARETGLRFVMPAAPNAWRHGGEGRAWFEPPLSQARRPENVLAEVASARRRIEGVLETLASQGADRVAIVGFSQGAMMALDVVLMTERQVDAVGLLSGAPLPSWEPRYATRGSLPVFISHGRSDPLLPFRDADALRARLEGAGAEIDWVPFDGGHAIPPTVRQRLAAFLRRTMWANP